MRPALCIGANPIHDGATTKAAHIITTKEDIIALIIVHFEGLRGVLKAEGGRRTEHSASVVGWGEWGKWGEERVLVGEA